MNAELGMMGEKVVNEFGFVGREVISDDVDLASEGLGGHHLGKEVDELGAGMALSRLAKDFSASGIKGRVKRKSGAFGLWSTTAPVAAHLTTGLANADSWATDFHKWLNVPYDSGLALVRDANSLRAAMAITAEYLPTDSPFRNPSDYTPELSRRARGVEVWAALRSLGRSGVIELVEHNCRQARRFAEGLRSAGYQVINEVTLNQVLVVFGDAETTHRVVTELQTEGTCWCGVTVWQGRTAMRISVSSWATTDLDVERSLDAMLRIARKYCL